MRAEDFRRIALGLSEAVEAAHMGHPDFRVNGRIFATIHPDHQYGMVKLTPEQQHHFVTGHPSVFAPENGAWGRQGCTRVRLDAADEELLGEAMTLAWQNTVNSSATKPAPTRRRQTGSSRSSRRPRA
jgi:hypothetical protein